MVAFPFQILPDQIEHRGRSAEEVILLDMKLKQILFHTTIVAFGR